VQSQPATCAVVDSDGDVEPAYTAVFSNVRDARFIPRIMTVSLLDYSFRLRHDVLDSARLEVLHGDESEVLDIGDRFFFVINSTFAATRRVNEHGRLAGAGDQESRPRS